MSLKDLLGKQLLFFDGGMGTMLQGMGLQPGEIPEYWNMEHPDRMVDIHYQYYMAGANVISTNTFGANPVKFPQDKYKSADIVAADIALAKEARDKVQKETGRDNLYIITSIGPTGKLLKPLGDLEFDQAYDGFKTLMVAAEKAGSDALLIETMTDSYEIKAAVLAAKENTNLPIVVTVMLDENGKLLTGGTIQSLNAMLEGLGVDAVGLNCGFGPDQIAEFVPEYLKTTSLPMLVNPNAGLPQTDENGNTIWALTPDEFGEKVAKFAEEGVFMLGGCCGTTPAHIKALVAHAKDIVPPAIEQKHDTVVSSSSKAVVINDDFTIIGEKINPTGNKPVKAALKENNVSALLNLATEQVERGAHILDVNVGLPEIDEVEMLPRVIKEIQAITDTPLMLDTSNYDAMEQAARYYNGKPFINSVSGKQESMDKILPIAQKYGGVLIALTLDDKGIPKTSDARVDVALKIIAEAEKYGISKNNIVVDPLTLTISADPTAAHVTLETVAKLKALGIKTSLGISNISFGLPAREVITATFLSTAIAHGLNAAIMNPLSDKMMEIYHSVRALGGFDVNCAEYITKYENYTVTSGTTGGSGNSGTAGSGSGGKRDLKEMLVKGLKDDAYHETEKVAATGMAPLDIVNQYVIPALDQVGALYEQGKVYLPQLLMTAEAAQSAFIVIKKLIEQDAGADSISKGKIVIATVKGDIHDIGKNIVKVLLENYGYEVIDLGKDVPPEDILDAAKRENVKLVGLSALMTTTVPSMEETIRLLNEHCPDCKVAVGGAVLNENYAEMINADYYCKDAMATVKCAEQLYNC